MASSGVARVFKAGTAMLAAAKSGAATATAAAKKPKAAPAGGASKPKAAPAGGASKPKRAAPTRQTGIFKAMPVSPELSRFLGTPEASRTDAVKKIWAYIKLNNLQNPSNKKEIMCDEKLKVVFGKDRVQFLEIGKLLTAHFLKTG